jgi:hypothetical protein
MYRKHRAGGHCIGEQGNAQIGSGQPLGHDARTDDGRKQQCRAKTFCRRAFF